MLVSSSLHFLVLARIRSFSLGMLVCETLNECLFFKRLRAIFREPLGNVEIYYNFSFENVTNEQKSETVLTFPVCEHL